MIWGRARRTCLTLPGMSRTAAISFRGRMLWVTTEGLQQWLRLLVDESENVEGRDEDWFSDLRRDWSIQAEVDDLGATLSDAWSNQQVAVLLEMARAAQTAVSDDRVMQISDGWIQLLSGDLPPDPPSAWWFLGAANDGWRQMAKRTSD